MILTFAEDFTSTIDLDSELVGTPESGLYWNRGVHPILTIEGLLSILPIIDFTFSDWDSETTYNKFNTSRKKTDIVTLSSKIYQSLTDTNLNNSPDSNPTKWLLTNLESIRIKSFIWTVEDDFRAALTLDRKLIENQFIYNVGETLQTLSNDFSGWAFEPKGSDYVKIRINQIALQANTSTPQSLFVINQGRLITTLTLNPDNGNLLFEDIGYTISGKGRFLFVIDSQEVLSDNAFNDPLRYDGFVTYPVTGIGATAEGAVYSDSSTGNGLNFNVSAYLDSTLYITNNQIDFAKFLQVQMELDFVKTLLHSANFRSNREERTLLSSPLTQQLLSTEALNLDLNTIAAKYVAEKKIAVEAVNKTFDKFLKKKKSFTVNRTVI
ncbi:MAG: hypothetical protein IID16_01050 [Candidatus Marinimicrobia bacterium]|nr:hypothetical protein [Candidatus Neomarinimicrobiota bacterium]